MTALRDELRAWLNKQAQYVVALKELLQQASAREAALQANLDQLNQCGLFP